MRATWVVLLLALPALSGCLSVFDEADPDAGREAAPPRDVADPSSYTVTGVEVHGDEPGDAITVTSADGTQLSVLVYEPLSPDALPNGSAPHFPVVVFLHGWGNMKEDWQNVQYTPESPPVDLLERFAMEGFVSVAYDARGFGRSGGEATVAGPAEMQDLDAVITYARETYPTTHHVGVTGLSYGGGQALQAWAKNDKVTTAVPHQGWTDLYDALLPGNVPKAEWAAALAAGGVAGAAFPDPEGGSPGNVHPIMAQWMENAALRQNLGTMESQMDVRSVSDRLERVDKPLLLCQGMQESLFPQFHDALLHAGGFTRAYVHTGGHGTYDEACWDRTLAWFHFFLRGVENGVDGWPFLQTVDADSDRPVLSYSKRDLEATRDGADRYFLRMGQLAEFESSAEFTIDQRVASNPLVEPGVLWDQAGMSYNPTPHQVRFEENDPTAAFFTTAPLPASTVVVGAPRLVLELAEGSGDADFQVTVQLFHVIDDEGSESSRLLGRGAYAFVNGTTAPHGGTVEIPLDWTRATIDAGDRVVLKVSANESGFYLQYPGNYSVTFTGSSQFFLPTV